MNLTYRNLRINNAGRWIWSGGGTSFTLSQLVPGERRFRAHVFRQYSPHTGASGPPTSLAPWHVRVGESRTVGTFQDFRLAITAARASASRLDAWMRGGR